MAYCVKCGAQVLSGPNSCPACASASGSRAVSGALAQKPPSRRREGALSAIIGIALMVAAGFEGSGFMAWVPSDN